MRKYFIAGLLFWIPVWVTYVVIRFIIDFLDQWLSLVPANYQPDKLIGLHIPGLGVVLTVLLVFLTGLLVANIIGSRILSGWESLLSRIPLIRSIYTAVKQVLNAFMQPQSNSFRKVVMVEFPRPDSWAIGFQTSTALNNLPHKKTSVAVFIPTTPNPTAGFLMYIPVEQVIELEMSVEEAFKLIISIGVVGPAHGFQHRQ